MKGGPPDSVSLEPLGGHYLVDPVTREEVCAGRIPYLSSSVRRVSRREGVVVACCSGFASTALLFLALPFCQMISMAHKGTEVSALTDLSIAPPPAPIVAELPDLEDKELIERPVFRSTIQRLSLDQLALSLDPGLGDGLGGNFSMQFEVEAIDYVEMVFDISEVDRIPRPVYRVAPGYPYKLKEAGIGGTVWLYFVCDARGRVREISPQSSTHLEFEEYAIRALRKWRFEPGLKDGQKVKVRMLIPFNFRVREKNW